MDIAKQRQDKADDAFSWVAAFICGSGKVFAGDPDSGGPPGNERYHCGLRDLASSEYSD